LCSANNDFTQTPNKNKAAILVHCYAGAQRSATVVAAYLMKYCDDKHDWQNAVNYIKAKRDIAFYPETNFQKALELFQTSLQGNLTIRSHAL